jgi:hypothetical protein
MCERGVSPRKIQWHGAEAKKATREDFRRSSLDRLTRKKQPPAAAASRREKMIGGNTLKTLASRNELRTITSSA